jgi:predicted DNA-binding transcriptional regulator AlpA
MNTPTWSSPSHIPTRTVPEDTTNTRHRNLIPLADVLVELDVAKSTFFRWKATGRAPRTIKYPNGSLYVRRRDLEAWLTAHEEAA